MNPTKRIAIFVLYDPAGEVDTSKTYLLEKLLAVTDDLIIVINGEISAEGESTLRRYTDKILIRPNQGFDAWGYKEGMEYLKWEYLKQFDEMLHINDTCFGPIFPFEEMFHKMEKSSAEFWGITAHYPKNTLPFHLQTYFVCYRKKMFSNPKFKKFWQNLRPLNSYEEAVHKHEVLLTKYFSDRGFSWDVYIKMEDLAWLSARSVYDLPKELLERRCPLIKKRLFYMEYEHCFSLGLGINASTAFDYISQHTEYDVNIIWDYLLSKHPQSVFRKNLHLCEILPETASDPRAVQRKIALIFHITYADLIDDSFKYISAFPRDGHVYITTKPDSMKPILESKLKELNFSHFEVRVVKDRGRSESALLVECRDVIIEKNYDYICFAHDKKSRHMYPGTIASGFSYKCLENVLKSEGFVNNVINLFEKNPRLGFLAPPPPFHSAFEGHLAQKAYISEPDFRLLEKLLSELDIQPPVAQDDIFVALGSTFWFRPQALKKLFEYPWSYKHFPREPVEPHHTILHAIERIHTYVAQAAGFYSAWLMNDKYAAVELTNLFHKASLPPLLAFGKMADMVSAKKILVVVARMLVKKILRKFRLWDVSLGLRHKVSIFRLRSR